jgi:hypothetical protein
VAFAANLLIFKVTQMINKNIYILYPAGYTGTYLNWIIQKSEKSRAQFTVDDPISVDKNAHQHIKIPTHQSLTKTLAWTIYNKPPVGTIFSINVYNDPDDFIVRAAYAVQTILRFDPNPVIINIHDDNNPDIRKFAALNMVKKWPLFLDAVGVWHNDYNPFKDADRTRAFDWLLRNWETLILNNPPLNREEVKWNLDKHRQWVNIRHTKAPNEVTHDQYCIPTEIPDTVYDLSVKSTVDEDFIDQVERMLISANCGDFNFEHVRKFHPTFVKNQENTQWFNDIAVFRQTGVVSDFLNSHLLSQVFVQLEKK